jgi:hypothetical protein
MAEVGNAFFTPALQAWARGEIHWESSGDTFIAYLIRASVATAGDTYYTFSATHDLLSDVLTSARCPVAGQNIANPVSSDGAMDGDDITWASVTAATAAYGAVIVVKQNATEEDSQLLFYFDTGTGFPCTPDGNNITCTWAASTPYIAKLGST